MIYIRSEKKLCPTAIRIDVISKDDSKIRDLKNSYLQTLFLPVFELQLSRLPVYFKSRVKSLTQG